MRLRALPLTACLALAAAGATSNADAAPTHADSTLHPDPVKEACARAFDEGQDARDASRFADARAAFRRCAAPTCPALVRLDCSNGLGNLEERSPTLVFGARDPSGADVLDARVEIDDVVVMEQLDGRSIRVDPGPHTVRFRGKSGAVVEERIVVRPGEKDRLVLVSLPTSTKARLPGETASAGPSSSQTLTIAAFATAGAAVATFVTGLAVGIAGEHQVHGLEANPCAATQTCASSSVDQVRTKLAVSDVFIGVAAASAAVSITLFVIRGARRAAVVGLQVEPRLGGVDTALHLVF